MTQLPIPPESLRIGVGPFADPDVFLQSGRETVQLARRLVALQPHERVLDVGCGCGRVALALTEYLADAGTYVGFDPNREYIAWCTQHISGLDKRFRFEHIDVQAGVYNPAGKMPVEHLAFPYRTSTFDVALLCSVFTHMDEIGIVHYVRELARVLRPAGRCLVSALLMNDATRRAVQAETTIFMFVHPLGQWNWTCDPDNPLEAVSNNEQWLCEMFAHHGFRVEGIEYGNWRDVRSYAIQHDWLAVRRLPDIMDPENWVVSLNCCDEVLSAEYHNIRASQGMKVS